MLISNKNELIHAVDDVNELGLFSLFDNHLDCFHAVGGMHLDHIGAGSQRHAAHSGGSIALDGVDSGDVDATLGVDFADDRGVSSHETNALRGIVGNAEHSLLGCHAAGVKNDKE